MKTLKYLGVFFLLEKKTHQINLMRLKNMYLTLLTFTCSSLLVGKRGQ